MLSVLSWNVEGLNSCIRDCDFLNFVAGFDFLFCIETWERNNDNFIIEGFDKIAVPRVESLNSKSKRGHGGVCLFYKCNLEKLFVVEKVDKSGFIWIKFLKQYFKSERDIYVCFCYIPPANSPYFLSHDTGFFEQLENDVRMYRYNGYVSVIGDLNARVGDKCDFDYSSEQAERYLNLIVDKAFYSTDLPCRCSLDKTVNTSGNKLINLCISSDLRIANGRVGDDSGVGSYTYMSTAGNSLIDYVLCSGELFPLLDDLIIHDLQVFSSHTPIQVNFIMSSELEQFGGEQCINEKLRYESSKSHLFIEQVNNQMHSLSTTINQICNNSLPVDAGVDVFSNTLYNIACSVFGTSTKSSRTSNSKTKRKFRNKWFNNECEVARKEFRVSCRKYKASRAEIDLSIMKIKRKEYQQIIRKAKACFNIKQKRDLNDVAKHNPQLFWKEIKKFKDNHTINNCIPNDVFFNHFKDLFSNSIFFKNDSIEEELNCFLGDTTESIESLDKEINISEVKQAINGLKRGKSTGYDKLAAEIFIDCVDILSPILCNLFNFIFSTSIYPETWTRSIIVPVPKKGNLNDVNNYRAISLTSIFSKIFSSIINRRLTVWAESTEILNDFQFGFRKGRSTCDCVFVLNSLIDKVVNAEKNKLYCCFVDFKKAFDLVYRNGMFVKLFRYGCSQKIIKIVQSMYKKVSNCIRTNGICTDFFIVFLVSSKGRHYLRFYFCCL